MGGTEEAAGVVSEEGLVVAEEEGGKARLNARIFNNSSPRYPTITQTLPRGLHVTRLRATKAVLLVLRSFELYVASRWSRSISRRGGCNSPVPVSTEECSNCLDHSGGSLGSIAQGLLDEADNGSRGAIAAR